MADNYMIKVNLFEKVNFLKSKRKKKAFIEDEEFHKLYKCCNVFKKDCNCRSQN